MKIASIIVRILMGLMFAFASIAYILKLFDTPEITGNMKIFNDGLAASVYLMPTVKAIELICAIAFLSGRFVSLATVVIFPIVFNILLVHVFLDPSGLALAIFMMIGNIFLAYYHRNNYKGLWSSK